jgi:uncharacterized protein YhbP (UPF0306 family)
MTKEEFDKAALYWELHDEKAVKMADADVKKAAERFIASHNTCALATGSGAFVRCTPLEYTYKDGNFYILSEGGQKFRALGDNPAVSLAVFEPYKGFGSIESIQVTGTAAVLGSSDAEFLSLLEYKKIPASAPVSKMHLIRIKPQRYELLFSSFKKEGYDPRQQTKL